MTFDPRMAKERLDRFWSLSAEFGQENDAHRVYLSEIVSDRYVLVNGLQLLRDELQLAGEHEQRIATTTTWSRAAPICPCRA